MAIILVLREMFCGEFLYRYFVELRSNEIKGFDVLHCFYRSLCMDVRWITGLTCEVQNPKLTFNVV